MARYGAKKSRAEKIAEGRKRKHEEIMRKLKEGKFDQKMKTIVQRKESKESKEKAAEREMLNRPGTLPKKRSESRSARKKGKKRHTLVGEYFS